MARTGQPSRGARAAKGKGSAAIGDYVLEDQIGHVLRRAHQRATAIFMTELGEPFQITPTQFAALAKLYVEGEQSQNQLGRLTAMDPATVQGVTKRLEARRLIERSGDPGDRRRANLRLTAAGADLIRAMIAHGIAVSDATLAPLAEDERGPFLEMLRRLA